jgi:hypothetical protein
LIGLIGLIRLIRLIRSPTAACAAWVDSVMRNAGRRGPVLTDMERQRSALVLVTAPLRRRGCRMTSVAPTDPADPTTILITVY